MEATAEALQTEVEFYRQNQTVVEEEIRTLIADNQKLSQQVEALLKEKLDNFRQVQNDDQSREVEELKKQVAVIAKERDSLYVLWQTSQKTIEALETELKSYTQYDNRGNQHPHENRKDLELKLQTALTDYIELERKHKELIAKRSSLENDVKNKEKEIATYKERGKELDERIQELMRTLEEYKINFGVQLKTNEDLKNQLSETQKEIKEKTKREMEAKSKVAEALQLYDLVTSQKNEALKRIQELKAETARLKESLNIVRADIEAVCKKEVEQLRNKYNEKVTDMLLHIKNLDSELVEKGLLLNKTLRENAILQTENENLLKQQQYCYSDDPNGENAILQTENENLLKQQQETLSTVDPKLAIANQRMEAMFQELVASERRNTQLVCEKQCLALDIQRIQDIHTREIKRRDWEESLLKNQCDEMKVQIEHLQKSLDETHGMVNKLQKMLSSRTELNQKMVSTKEEELIELNKHLENQMELNRKWKESYVEMTEKLKKKLEAINRENNELRARLKLPHLGSSSLEDSTAS